MMSRFETRCNKLRRLIRKAGADALLVTHFPNVTYLTGFTGHDSYLLVAPKNEILLTDTRYEEQLGEECPGLELDVRRSGVKMIDRIKAVAEKAKPLRLAVEAGSITLSLYEQLKEKLKSIELVSSTDLVEQLRMVKDADEIKAIRRAAWQARRAFDVVRMSLTPEMTERRVAADLEYQLRRFGARGYAFAPIIAVGARASLPHGSPTDERIGAADFTLFDWGADEGLYRSDLTRIVVTGKISPKLEATYGLVLKAQLAAIEAIRPGATCQEVDEVARGIIAKAGHGKHFGHGLGHGIGLEIHEAPRLAKKQKQELKAGMVITVEPGIYIPGWGGVRIEDDVLVTRSGFEVLSDVPKELADCVVT